MGEQLCVYLEVALEHGSELWVQRAVLLVEGVPGTVVLLHSGFVANCGPPARFPSPQEQCYLADKVIWLTP
jgi:hypothetical protein